MGVRAQAAIDALTPAAGDARYVNVTGDTMTGELVVVFTTIHQDSYKVASSGYTIWTPATDGTGSSAGLSGEVELNGTKTAAEAYGVYAAAYKSSTGLLTNGFGVLGEFYNSAANTTSANGVSGQLILTSGTITNGRGVYGLIFANGGTITDARAVNGLISLTGASTSAATAYGLVSAVVVSAGATVTNAYGFGLLGVEGVNAHGCAVDSVVGSATAYGLLIGSVTAPTSWGIYVNNSNNNVIGGALAVGSTTAPTYKIDVTGNVRIAGNISKAAWTTTGIGLVIDAATYTDTTSSGTIPTVYVHAIATPTLAASAATTINSAVATLRIASGPVAGSNVTISGTKYALLVSADFAGFFGGLIGNGTVTLNASAGTNVTNIGTGTTTGTVTIGGGSNAVTVNATTLTLGAEITLVDGADITVNATTGTKIGTAITQKLGFYNATPIVQRAGAAQVAVATTGATNVAPFGYTTAAQANAIVTLVNELRDWAVAQGFIKGAA